MARQLKLPMARVISNPTPEIAALLGKNERIMIVDLVRLRASKTYAQLAAQAAEWDEAAREDYVLALIAQGVA